MRACLEAGVPIFLGRSKVNSMQHLELPLHSAAACTCALEAKYIFLWRGIYFRIFFRFFLGICFSLLASWLLGFLASWLLGFLASWLLGFLAFRLLGFLASRLLGFLASWLLGFLASWLLGFSASWLLGFWASRLFGFLLVYAAFGGFLAFRILCIPSSSSAGGVFPTSWGGLPPPPTPPLRFRFSAEM